MSAPEAPASGAHSLGRLTSAITGSAPVMFHRLRCPTSRLTDAAPLTFSLGTEHHRGVRVQPIIRPPGHSEPPATVPQASPG